jgi:hypothetical protein
MRWDAILKRLPENAVMAEIGVWKGTNARNILAKNTTVKMHLIDRWTVYTRRESKSEGVSKISLNSRLKFKIVKKQTFAKMAAYPGRVSIIDLDSITASKSFPAKCFDLVFIDALHSYGGCKADISAWLPKVKPGGWIGGHDYGRREGVTRAVVEAFGKENVETDSDYTWFVRVK